MKELGKYRYLVFRPLCACAAEVSVHRCDPGSPLRVWVSETGDCLSARNWGQVKHHASRLPICCFSCSRRRVQWSRHRKAFSAPFLFPAGQPWSRHYADSPIFDLSLFAFVPIRVPDL